MIVETFFNDLSLNAEMCGANRTTAHVAIQAPIVHRERRRAIAGWQKDSDTMDHKAQENSSYANVQHTACQHLDLTLTVDFNNTTLAGTAIWTVSINDPQTTHVVLDTKTLDITNVRLSDDSHHWQEAQIELGQENEVFGRPLAIALPDWAQQSISVEVSYNTSAQASAIQWLDAAQTRGKQHPYLFTQCQAIHARSLFPCQDTPQIKFTYTGQIDVPKPLTACMSALPDGSSEEGDRIVYKFNQPVPIPSYLLAIAVGNIECRQIGRRSYLYTEPEMMEECVAEFGSTTELYVDTAESICGEYVWGVYGLLVLPPSFPYGGMENPCLTFVTPTLLAGDQSLTTVVAHEVAHSWMGNLVTNRTWEHFWLNEGFTVYLERLILSKLKGENIRDLSALIGYESLRRSCDHFGPDHPFTCLIPNLDGVDPDDAFSRVPYEKGFCLLLKLEKMVGGQSQMEQYLRAHCDRFKFSTIDSTEFSEYFMEFFHDIHRLKDLDWECIFSNVGMPELPDLDTTLSDNALNLAHQSVRDWQNAELHQVKEWETMQKIVFLEALTKNIEEIVESEDHDSAKYILTFIDKQLELSNSTNSEIRFHWYSVRND